MSTSVHVDRDRIPSDDAVARSVLTGARDPHWFAEPTEPIKKVT